MKDDAKKAAWRRILASSLGLVMPVALFAVLAWGYLAPGTRSSGLARHVDEALAESGVESRVTAVLLNYRAYDTLLECFVLFLGVAVVWSMRPSRSAGSDSPADPVLLSLVRLLAPFLVLIGIYLLWAGSSQAGGAFQAGAIFGGAGVLLLLTSSRLLSILPGKLLSPGICLGPFFFLLAAFGAMALGGNFLEYRRESAAMIVIALEVMAAFSIGLSLAVFFGGSHPEESCESRSGGGISPGEGEES
ncbi:MAG: sodium:proton antiporter [Proteobacteria bacterium]|nr:sodium:proton antiporter [Pseudomonadota bacterium]MBU1738544.1 sodium:proton antiporter [Pseudomonadota bacterium]